MATTSSSSAAPAGPPPPRRRARELGIRIGLLPTGPTNTIVDVANVAVGQVTLWRDEPAPPDGRGVARTGVTAIVPFAPEALFEARVPAGAAVLNGAGEVIGITSIEEWGVIETPIVLTSSMAIGRAYDAAVELLVERIPGAGIDDALMPVVAECDDGHLNSSRRVQLGDSDVRAAILGARGVEAGPVALGVVGAGTGMTCFELKGGIGSASRRVVPVDRRMERPASGVLPGVPPGVPPGALPGALSDARGRAAAGGSVYTVGVLALTNFGRLERLTVDGVRVGEALLGEGWPTAGGAVGDPDPSGRGRERGSCVVVVATDAPLLPNQLTRLARRAGLGLARMGSTAGHGSGEIFLAFSTGIRLPREAAEPLLRTEHLRDDVLDPFFGAVVEATEEAVLDSLLVADTVVGRAGHRVPGLPVERILELLRAAGRPVVAG